MTTVSELIEETKHHLYSGYQEQLVFLSGTLLADATDTTLTFSSEMSAVQVGETLAIDLELMYVRAVNEATSQATVIRAFRGSKLQTHADDAMVTIAPKFSNFNVWQALNHELTALSSPVNGLFRVLTTLLTPQAGRYGYDLAGLTGDDVIDVIDIKRDLGDVANSYPFVDGWRFDRAANTSDFPSGMALIFTEGVSVSETLHIRYMAPFSPLSETLTDDASTTGMLATMYDIPPLAAAARLIPAREVKRNFTESQGETRRAEEVPPGAVANSGRDLRGLVRARIREEAIRLSRMYPKRKPQPMQSYPLTNTGYRR